MDGEPDRVVEADRCRVVGVDVEHADVNTGPGGSRSGQMIEPGEGQGTPESEAVEIGVDGDDVDLPEDRIMVGVHLGPTEPGQPAVALVEQETGRIEPVLVLTRQDRRRRPAALFGVPLECPIVDRQPGRLVVPRFEFPRDQVERLVDRQWDAHLMESASGRQPHRGSHGIVGRGRLEHPPMDVTATFDGDLSERSIEHLGTDRRHLVAMMGVDDQLDGEGVVALGDLGVGDRVGMTRLPGAEPDEPLSTALGEVEPQMIRQWAVSIGPFGCPQEAVHLGHIVRGELPLDVETTHAVRLLGEGRAPGRRGDGRPWEGRSLGEAVGSVHRMGTPRTPKGRARQVAARLIEAYPEAICELDHANPFQLLCATVLSAQTTDARVNMVTPVLFARYPTAADLAGAEPGELEQIIRSTGFYQAKARNLTALALRLVEVYAGEVPTALDDLVTLAGVGRKTANVVRSVAFGLPGLPVDTHVGRLARRLGLTTDEDPVKIEMELNGFIPAAQRGGFSLRLILHGRRVCDARKPKCGECSLSDMCPSSQVPRLTRASADLGHTTHW